MLERIGDGNREERIGRWGRKGNAERARFQVWQRAEGGGRAAEGGKGHRGASPAWSTEQRAARPQFWAANPQRQRSKTALRMALSTAARGPGANQANQQSAVCSQVLKPFGTKTKRGKTPSQTRLEPNSPKEREAQRRFWRAVAARSGRMVGHYSCDMARVFHQPSGSCSGSGRRLVRSKRRCNLQYNTVCRAFRQHLCCACIVSGNVAQFAAPHPVGNNESKLLCNTKLLHLRSLLLLLDRLPKSP